VRRNANQPQIAKRSKPRGMKWPGLKLKAGPLQVGTQKNGAVAMLEEKGIKLRTIEDFYGTAMKHTGKCTLQG
jgi:hypothetical protein